MGNEQAVEYARQHNYFQLILDTYQSAKLLNSLDLGVLDEALGMFRENLFIYPDFGRKATTKSIALLIEKEASSQPADSNIGRILHAYNGNSTALARDIFSSSQVVLEFLDKGMKGLLSGDLSSFAVKEIQRVIEKGLPKMEGVQAKIQEHMESEAKDLGEYFNVKLGITRAKEEMNQPVYSPSRIDGVHEQLRDQLNVEDYMIKKQLQVSDEVGYVGGSARAETDQKPVPRFTNPKNMEMYTNKDLEREGSQARSEEEVAQMRRNATLRGLEEQLNKVINAMYNDLARQLFKLDAFLLPVHGIPHPDSENPMNLFKR